MAPQRKRDNRENAFFNVGVQGRLVNKDSTIVCAQLNDLVERQVSLWKTEVCAMTMASNPSLASSLRQRNRRLSAEVPILDQSPWTFKKVRDITRASLRACAGSCGRIALTLLL
jgi:hypothetical protein